MTPVEMSNRYSVLRQRVNSHAGRSCSEISVMLPANLGDELAFYRLVNWCYVLVNEAARIPLRFLLDLPPARGGDTFRDEVSKLRTYVAHNLDVGHTRDQKTSAFAHAWFRKACGVGSPASAEHYGKCCAFLAERLGSVLEACIAACDLLDSDSDGPRLVRDLKKRIDLMWDAHEFDAIVSECAGDLGNFGLDLVKIRRKNLDSWRKILEASLDDERDRALRLGIEAALLQEIADRLPITGKEAAEKLALEGPERVAAALLLLRDARRFGRTPVHRILEIVGREAVEPQV